jgi:hypothetical protein
LGNWVYRIGEIRKIIHEILVVLAWSGCCVGRAKELLFREGYKPQRLAAILGADFGYRRLPLEQYQKPVAV